MKYIYVICCLFLITIKVSAQDLSGVTILVNPGHGGFDSDDRNITPPVRIILCGLFF